MAAPDRKFSTGPAVGQDYATGVILSSPQAEYPYVWAGDVVPLTTTTPGTDTACTNGGIFWTAVYVRSRTTLTGATNLIGSVGGTTKVVYGLYNAAGTLVANTAVAGVVVGTAATLQTRIPFTAPYVADQGLYFAACQFDGTNAKFRSIAIGNIPTGTQTGTFGTLATITPVTTFVADTGPIVGLY